MQYRSRRTKEIMEELEGNDGITNVCEDFLHGSEYLELGTSQATTWCAYFQSTVRSSMQASNPTVRYT
jgi:hypothetical protein